jgi:hypothetical protein
VSIEALAIAAWGDRPPSSARHTIATHVLRLRRAGLAVVTITDGYRLETHTDRGAFERLISSAQALSMSDPAKPVSVWRDALALWRDRPFPELDNLPEAAIEVSRLENWRTVRERRCWRPTCRKSRPYR